MEDHDGLVAEIYRFIGTATNNVAEYSALISALEYAVAQRAEALTVYSDSEVMVRQVTGVYTVGNPTLRGLAERAWELIAKIPNFQLHHIPREKNKAADALANRAMDEANVADVP